MSDMSAHDRVRHAEYVWCFKQLALLAQRYYEAVDDLPPMPGWESAFELEQRIARLALASLDTADAVLSLGSGMPAGTPPRYIKRKLDRFISTIKAQLERWGWGFIQDADGEARIRARIEAHDQDKRVPLLRTALAWRSMPDVQDHRNADGLADEAERLGLEPLELPPGTSPETAEEQTWARYYEWRDTPVLGSDLPSRTEDELLVLAKASDVLRFHAEWLTVPEGETAAVESDPESDAVPSAADARDERDTLAPGQKTSNTETAPSASSRSSQRRRGGRPSDTDPKEDRRIAEAWQTGQHARLDDLARTLGITKRDAKRCSTVTESALEKLAARNAVKRDEVFPSLVSTPGEPLQFQDQRDRAME